MTISRPRLQIGQACASGRLVAAVRSEPIGVGRRADGEQNAALLQFLLTDPIGEEPEVADPDQSGRQNVKQKSADELDRFQRHGLGPAAIFIVLPLKADAAIFEGLQAVVGNRHAVRVAGQILKDPFWSAKGRLDVNDPFDVCGFLTQSPECGRLSQTLKFAGEMEPAFAESQREGAQEGFPEAAAEDAHGEEEGGLPAGDPA